MRENGTQSGEGLEDTLWGKKCGWRVKGLVLSFKVGLEDLNSIGLQLPCMNLNMNSTAMGHKRLCKFSLLLYYYFTTSISTSTRSR